VIKCVNIFVRYSVYLFVG